MNLVQIDKFINIDWNIEDDGQTNLTTIKIQISKDFTATFNQLDYNSSEFKLFWVK